MFYSSQNIVITISKEFTVGYTTLLSSKKVTADALNFTADGGKYLPYCKVTLVECHDCYLVNQLMIQVVISISCGWQGSSEIENKPNTQPVLAFGANAFSLEKQDFFFFNLFLVLTFSYPPFLLDCENSCSPAGLPPAQKARPQHEQDCCCALTGVSHHRGLRGDV